MKSILVGGAGDELERTFPGKIRAAEKVELAFQVSGQLIKLNVRNGQEVKKNEVLAQLDSRDFASNLKAAKAEFNRAQAEFKRMGELVERQLVSRSEFDQKKARRDIAEADAERAQKALNDTYLRAPFAGEIAITHVDNFQDVNAKQPIVSLQDPSNLEVIINIPENSILRTTGSPDESPDINPRARFDALPEKLFSLNLKEFATQADPNTQTFEVVLVMDKPEELNVLPGMSVSVMASLPTREQSSGLTVIPATSLFADREGGNDQFVWIVNETDMTVVRRAVKIGALRGGSVEVLDGISNGERIVTAGVHYLEEGQQVSLLQKRHGG
ncbi:efflux RND transporter periplasmic adaptor subunit [Maricurvus nonylphenolicus]|uniref:efflux RND transporter periplasmic adaptor subunit n=1 Tax=Maricurvus nonylphenolicus TaxID=1008307 RepID=UPI0036F1BFF5